MLQKQREAHPKLPAKQQQIATAIQEIRLPHQLAAILRRPRAALREVPHKVLPPEALHQAITTREVPRKLLHKTTVREAHPEPQLKAVELRAVHPKAALHLILQEAARRAVEEVGNM